MNKKFISRRSFVKKTTQGSTFIVFGGVLPQFSAKSYGRILGSNSRFNVSVMGLNSRGSRLAKNFANQKKCDVIHVCDVDSRAKTKSISELSGIQKVKTKGYGDFRKSLESKDVDILVIAAPDHWHAPASIMALQAGKHVYVEKPCSHNPNEGEILVKAAKYYGKVVQMGNQRRSWPNVVKGINAIKNGAIGRVYFGRGWYSNNRPSIGIGKKVDPPKWLDWELWQGPAPRRELKDNLLHYNWHWHWHWGTGEALNNGTHMIDLLRWGMGVDYPIRVSSSGGRYRYDDDWETPDTQTINLDFKDDLSMSWESRSCNGKYSEGSSVGIVIYGEKGSLLIPGGNSYKIFDLNNKIIEEEKYDKKIDSRDKVNPSEYLDALHIRNMFDAISHNKKLNSDIVSGHKSTLLVQLGNIAYRVGRTLNIDHNNGHIINDDGAMKFWSRNYEKGWSIKI